MLPGAALNLALSRGNVAYSSPSKRPHSVEWAAATSGSWSRKAAERASRASGSWGGVCCGCKKCGGVLEPFVPRPHREVCCGGVLLSHTLPGAVPSALAGLASRFGMEAGRFPAAMTTTRWFNHIHLNAPERVPRVKRWAFGGLCWL